MSPDELRDKAREAARSYRHAERELCDLLAAIDQCRLWRTRGYSCLVHYAEHELGLSHRKALELVRVEASLKALPELSRAFREQDVPFSKIREASRVATPGSDADWARRVREGTYRDVEREVCAERRAATITLKVELAADEYDRVERAFEAIRRRRGRATPVSDCLDTLATTFLAVEASGDGASRHPDGGGAAFTQVLYRCETCDRAEVETRRGSAQVSREVLQQAECDSVVLQEGTKARRPVPVSVSRAVWRRARGRCETCGQRGWLHLHHRVAVSDGGGHDASNLSLLCSAFHRGEHRRRGREVAQADGWARSEASVSAGDGGEYRGSGECEELVSSGPKGAGKDRDGAGDLEGTGKGGDARRVAVPARV